MLKKSFRNKWEKAPSGFARCCRQQKFIIFLKWFGNFFLELLTWKFFLMWFDNEIDTTYKYNQTCLSEIRSTRIPAIRNKVLVTDFSQRISTL